MHYTYYYLFIEDRAYIRAFRVCLGGWLQLAWPVRQAQASPGLPQVVQLLMFSIKYATCQAHLRLCLIPHM
jgi:hypothetical protein